MKVWAESSAVLAWLFGETDGQRVLEVLRRAELVITSELVLVECERALIRAITLGQIDESQAANCRAEVSGAALHWYVSGITPDIIERAKQPFPCEPVRTLDAIHLASALAMRSFYTSIELLSLDNRVRRAGSHLGFRLQPS